MKKVIIGAGPAGLYTAIKLRKAGVLDVVVYDPRAGNYTRPGHLNRSVFAKAQEGLDIEFWKFDKVGHIKDLERALYKEAVRLGIKIEKKRFVKLHQDAKKPGVVVASDGGEDEIVEADYVFDCTGTRRQVVAAVNQVVPESPLQLSAITELPVRNHFLAYVKISKSDWSRFERDSEFIRAFPQAMDAETYTQAIIKLRALGWKEFKFPRCYGMEFGKDKVCLYLHAPDNLDKANYDAWVQTVLECYTKPIRYEHLPPSPKPRFLPFPMSAQALQDVSYKGKNLPTVIPLGDAQIDFDYYLAHGIKDGMERIDALFGHMEVFDNEIHYFDSAEYLQAVKRLLREHKQAVIKEADQMRESFVAALEPAQLKFRQALLASTKTSEQATLSEILKEIEARQGYVKARQVFAGCHNASNQVVLTPSNVDAVIAKLNVIQIELLKARSGLPVSFVAEHKEVEELLLNLAVSWKEVGNALFKNKNLAEAIDAYKKSLEIYNLDAFFGKHSLKELPIYSNLAIVYLQSKLYSEAIASAYTALSIFDRCYSEDKPVPLQEKIIFNLIKAMCAQAQVFIESSKHKDAKLLHLQATNIVSSHETKLTGQILASIREMIGELQRRLPSSNDGSSLRRSSGGTLVTEGGADVDKEVEDTDVSQLLTSLGLFAGKSAVGQKTPSVQQTAPLFQ